MKCLIYVTYLLRFDSHGLFSLAKGEYIKLFVDVVMCFSLRGPHTARRQKRWTSDEKYNHLITLILLPNMLPERTAEQVLKQVCVLHSFRNALR